MKSRRHRTCGTTRGNEGMVGVVLGATTHEDRDGCHAKRMGYFSPGEERAHDIFGRLM